MERATPNSNTTAKAAAPTIQTGEGGNSDVQISAVRSVGIASVSLRGFGPNRNLVLVNGKRPTPINALMVTDINSVPSSLIERVEIITGGASAVYGADAVGGVTNFILKDDFEGFEFDGLGNVPTLYRAEEHHQDFFAKNPGQGYCLAVALPKVNKVRKAFSEYVRAA